MKRKKKRKTGPIIEREEDAEEGVGTKKEEKSKKIKAEMLFGSNACYSFYPSGCPSSFFNVIEQARSLEYESWNGLST